MARGFKPVLVLLAASLAVAAVSPAARPIPDAVYKGRTAKGKKITLKVSDSGKRLTFKVSCGVDRSRAKGVKVRRKGRFHVERKRWEARGRFKTRRKAKGTIEGLFCFIGQDSWTAKRR